MAVRWKRVFLLTVVVLMAVIYLHRQYLRHRIVVRFPQPLKALGKQQPQIKTVTNNVIFPVVDCVLAILLFVKLAMAYFDCASIKAI